MTEQEANKAKNDLQQRATQLALLEVRRQNMAKSGWYVNAYDTRQMMEIQFLHESDVEEYFSAFERYYGERTSN